MWLDDYINHDYRPVRSTKDIGYRGVRKEKYKILRGLNYV